MTQGAALTERRRLSLRGRLLLTLTAVLAPVLVIAGILANLQVADAQRRRVDALLTASEPVIVRMESELGRAQALLTVFESAIASGNCAEAFARIQIAVPSLANVFSGGSEGDLSCAARGNLRARLNVENAMARFRAGDPIYWTNAVYGRLSEAWVIGVLRPLKNADGTIAGFVGLSVDANQLSKDSPAFGVNNAIHIALAEPGGMVFGGGSLTFVEPSILRASNMDRAARSIRTEQEDGTSVSVVLRPFRTAGLYGLIWSDGGGLSTAPLMTGALVVAMPLTLFALLLGAVWFAVDRLVIRRLQSLQNLADAYAEGFYTFRPKNLEDAPREIAEFAEALGDMARRVDERDRAMRLAVSARDAAVREIHHRIKNNLQIVTSFVSLQGRVVTDPVASGVLRDVRHRIDALSILHQTLYHYERLDAVKLDQFFEALLNHLSDSLCMDDEDVTLRWDIAAVERSADIAIPLALFVLEAVSNSMKFAFSGEGGAIDVTLTTDGTTMNLTLKDNGRGIPSTDTTNGASPSGLGTRLMGAFAKQLGGQMTRTNCGQTGGCLVTLTLPDQARVIADTISGVGGTGMVSTSSEERT